MATTSPPKANTEIKHQTLGDNAPGPNDPPANVGHASNTEVKPEVFALPVEKTETGPLKADFVQTDNPIEAPKVDIVGNPLPFFATPAQPPVPPHVPLKGGMTRVIRATGLEQHDGSGRYVRVLQTSYINGAVLEPGAVTPWPAGVTVLGKNLEEYKG